uniref:NADH dehydrogenase [ubiquinone] 1 alpha subcomplex subunit 13 n=1 Tax=Plectus sambesii TaxID=2011161 RepID=A0A914WYY4_9BILA
MASSDGHGTSSGAESHSVVFSRGDASDDIWDDTALIEAYDRAVGLAYDAVNAAIRDSGDEELPKASHKKSSQRATDSSNRQLKKTNRAGRRAKKWKVGDLCFAPYSEDGEYYDALVKSLDSANDRCSVEFIGYNEVEHVALSSICKYGTQGALVLTPSPTTSHRPAKKRSRLAHYPPPSSSAVTVVASTSAVYRDSLNAVVRKKFRRDDDDAEEGELSADDDDDADEEQRDAPTSSVPRAVPVSHARFAGAASGGVARHSPIPLLAPPPPPAFADLPACSDQEALSSMLMSWYMSGYHTGYYQALQDARKKKVRKDGRDGHWLKLLRDNRDIENDLMKDVPGWKTGTWYGEPVYFTLGDKWWDPTRFETMAHSEFNVSNRHIMWKHHSEYAGPHWYDKFLPEVVNKYIW